MVGVDGLVVEVELLGFFEVLGLEGDTIICPEEVIAMLAFGKLDVSEELSDEISVEVSP